MDKEMNITEEELSVSELEQYCKVHGVKSFTYSHTYQDFNPELGPVRFYGKFRTLHTSLAPNTVAFGGEGTTLCLDNVKKITVEPGANGNAVFRFYCRHYSMPECDVQFVIHGLVSPPEIR